MGKFVLGQTWQVRCLEAYRRKKSSMKTSHLQGHEDKQQSLENFINLQIVWWKKRLKVDMLSIANYSDSNISQLIDV